MEDDGAAGREIVTERLIECHALLPLDRHLRGGGRAHPPVLRGVFEDPRAYEMAVKTFGAVEGARQTVGRLAAFVEGERRGSPRTT
jgi:hypothetical protein